MLDSLSSDSEQSPIGRHECWLPGSFAVCQAPTHCA